MHISLTERPEDASVVEAFRQSLDVLPLLNTETAPMIAALRLKLLAEATLIATIARTMNPGDIRELPSLCEVA